MVVFLSLEINLSTFLSQPMKFLNVKIEIFSLISYNLETNKMLTRHRTLKSMILLQDLGFQMIYFIVNSCLYNMKIQ